MSTGDKRQSPRLMEICETARPLRYLVEETQSFPSSSIIGKSRAMREVFRQIEAVATSQASVLLIGESGTGKELVAKAIHYASAKADRSFVAVNCTAFAPGLLESELFGHVRGAFTGAVADKVGRFELSGCGTLFLDEIAEIPVELQAKLLRVLQERTFERVGDSRTIPFKSRIVAATHRDLDAMVRKGTFREDLLYRLRVVEIPLPPLRDRPGDIPLLVDGLLTKINRELHKSVRAVAADTLALLQRYSWPGNVRELENVLTRAAVLARGDVLDASLLALPARPRSFPLDAEILPLHEVEKQAIERALHATNWNKRRTCRLLEISRPTLDRKIDEFGLMRPKP